MAKGRRLTSSRSDRLLGTGGYNYYDHDGMVSEVAEFGEEDVWSMVDDETSDNHHHRRHNHQEWGPRATVENGRRRGGASVMGQQEEKHVGGLSLAFEDKTTPSSRRVLHQYGGATGAGAGGPFTGRHVASSAPVNVPDWSKILRVNSSESCVDSDEDDPVDDSAVEPPHEYLARSRKKMNAFSVFEGVGRTLKGRDMTRVRDAIWSQTGFEGVKGAMMDEGIEWGGDLVSQLSELASLRVKLPSPQIRKYFFPTALSVFLW